MCAFTDLLCSKPHRIVCQLKSNLTGRLLPATSNTCSSFKLLRSIMYIWWQNGISVLSWACTVHFISPNLIPDSSAELHFPHWIASGGNFLGRDVVTIHRGLGWHTKRNLFKPRFEWRSLMEKMSCIKMLIYKSFNVNHLQNSMWSQMAHLGAE